MRMVKRQKRWRTRERSKADEEQLGQNWNIVRKENSQAKPSNAEMIDIC
jgi:hypothetical protein